MLKRTEKEGVYKDTKSGALINKSKDRLTAYKIQKQKMREINDLKTEVAFMKSQMETLVSEIEALKKKVE
jgi:hypothetical protein